jgi:histone deacetylase 6
VVHGHVKNAIAVIRPPGHHAECDRSMGFCHFDNVAIATQVARQAGAGIEKVLIVDWDVHHGNGIQQAFYDDPNVLYISIHVHEDGKFYPPGPYGDHLHCGTGAGLGKTVNIPWPTKGMGDADYLFAFQQLVMPIASDFDPDLVMVASGFDAADGDQLGGCFVTPECYARMTHMLMSLAAGKIVVCLEGGYNLESISMSALAVTKTLMGEAPPRIRQGAPKLAACQTVRMVAMHQQQWWDCLLPKDLSRDFNSFTEAKRLHDVVRDYQSSTLFGKHKMINLHVFRTSVSVSFENQVLATRNYHEEVPLLLIFHDPPEVTGKVDPVTGAMDLHEMTMHDAISPWISWAVRHGFGVMDVNIPKFLTGISDVDGSEEEEASKVNKATEEVALYVWENYIDTSDSRKVVLLGIGDAYRAVLHILNTRTWDNIQKYAGVACFNYNSTMRPVSEAFMNDFARTYYKTSHIVVSESHVWWKNLTSKKPSRKWGNIKVSPCRGLSRMMRHHEDDVRAFLLARAGLPSLEDEDMAEDKEEDFKLEDGGLVNGKKSHQRNGEDAEDTIMVGAGAEKGEA